MADGERPTRWQKARADWPGFQRRDLVVAVIGLAFAVGVLAILGFPGETVVEVAIVAGAGIVAALVYALGQLVWAWLQAPMRLLTADVIAIRRRLDVVPVVAPPTAPPFNMRLSLLDSLRLGEQLRQSSMMTMPAHEAWVAPVVAMLREHAEQEDTELFLRQNSLVEQLAVLRQLAEKYV